DDDVPPALVAGDVLVAVDLDRDHNRTLLRLRGLEPGAKLLDVRGADHLRPERFRVRGEIHRQVVAGFLAVDSERAVPAIAVQRPEAVQAERAREVADR